MRTWIISRQVSDTIEHISQGPESLLVIELLNAYILYSRNDLRNGWLNMGVSTWHWGKACPESDSLRYVTTQVLRCCTCV